jgi:hypothetical protein
LFRSKWELGGWRYAFIQAFNRSWPSLRNRVFDVSLFTIDPNGRRIAVGPIKELEVLNLNEMAAAVAAFRERGWRDVMRREIKDVGGTPSALKSPNWAPHFLNVRFRCENARLLPADTAMEKGTWLANRWRYTLYDFDPDNSVFGGLWSFRGRRGRKLKKVRGKRAKRGSAPSEIDPIHERMQLKLEHELSREFPRATVVAEEDWVDLAVRTQNALILYEIKTDPRPLMVIRQALGQLLEYAYHSCRRHGLPIRMVIVGRNPIGASDAQYFALIQKAFPVIYRQVSI